MRGTLRGLSAGFGFIAVLVGITLAAGTQQVVFVVVAVVGAAMVAVDLLIEGRRSAGGR